MRHLEILSNTSVQSENNYIINTKKKKHALVLQLGSSILFLHKGDSFLNPTLQNEFGIKLYGGKGAHYHPSVFLHWELYKLFLKIKYE